MLPKRVVAKLVDRIPASSRAPLSDIVEASINAFVAAEEHESQAAAERLVGQLRSGGPAVVGTGACFEGLRPGRAGILVIAPDYSSAPVRICQACGLPQEGVQGSPVCPECGTEEWREFDPKAEQTDCAVEVVNQSEALTRLGGVGCLLRFGLPEDMSAGAESRSSAG